jgi:hypothetical protein
MIVNTLDQVQVRCELTEVEPIQTRQQLDQQLKDLATTLANFAIRDTLKRRLG